MALEDPRSGTPGAVAPPVNHHREGDLMKAVLNSNLRIWHLVVAGVLLAVIMGTTIGLAAAPAAFWPAGSIRLASAQNANTITITGSNNPAVRVLRATISVPSGKKADLQAVFTADLHHGTGTYAYCFGEFTVDASPPDANFKPGSYQLIGGEISTQPNAVSVAMTGLRKGVGPGTHNVDVYVSSAYGGCTLFARAMTVVADIY